MMGRDDKTGSNATHPRRPAARLSDITEYFDAEWSVMWQGQAIDHVLALFGGAEATPFVEEFDDVPQL